MESQTKQLGLICLERISHKVPYDIRQNYGGCKGYAVVGPDGTVRGCHPSKANAEEQRMALYSVEEKMNKGISVGSMVSWNSSGGRAEGKVKRVVRDGEVKVPNSSFTITGTPENPAVLITVYRDGKPTDIVVGHRMNSLSTAKGSIWAGSFDPNLGGRNGRANV